MSTDDTEPVPIESDPTWLDWAPGLGRKPAATPAEYHARRADIDRCALEELADDWNIDLNDPRSVELLERTFAYAAKRLAIATRDLIESITDVLPGDPLRRRPRQRIRRRTR